MVGVEQGAGDRSGDDTAQRGRGRAAPGHLQLGQYHRRWVTQHPAPSTRDVPAILELATNLRRSFTLTEEAPNTRAFSWLNFY